MIKRLQALCLTIAVSASAVPALAFNMLENMPNLKIALNERQCMEGYSTLVPMELLDGGCFDQGRPYVKCTKKHPQWQDVVESTDRHCLSIYKAMAFNRRGNPNTMWNKKFSFVQFAGKYAYYLSQNALFMETLDAIDQAEMKKIAEQAKPNLNK